MAGSAQAGAPAPAPQYPRLDIQAFSGDGGVTITGGESIFVDATVFAIITDVAGNSVPLTPEDFTLTGTLVPNGGGGTTYAGTLDAGSYLSASFSDLTLIDFGSGLSGEIFGGLTYTGGSLQGGLSGGDILLTFNNFTPDFPVAAGKLGPVVVPVPAAVWLFGSGLIALVSVARRK